MSKLYSDTDIPFERVNFSADAAAMALLEATRYKIVKGYPMDRSTEGPPRPLVFSERTPGRISIYLGELVVARNGFAGEVEDWQRNSIDATLLPTEDALRAYIRALGEQFCDVVLQRQHQLVQELGRREQLRGAPPETI